MELSGPVGKLVSGYKELAVLTNPTVIGQQPVLGPLTITFSGKVRQFNSFWATQPPKKFGIWLGNSWWVWDGVVLETEIELNAILSGSLTGNPEARSFF